MNSSKHPMNQLPISLINPSHIIEDWNSMARSPADAPFLKTGLLHNANNNASSGSWRGLKSPSMVSHSKLSYLERVVLEIVESERMYVRDLRSIIENYLGKIIDTQELLLRPEQVSALFGNIEDIYELNSELLQELDSCHNDPVAVARCFVNRSQDFDIYTQYCNNYPNSVAALTECMRNKQHAKFFRERQDQIRHSLPLGSYLLKPVQRILKYHLLLQEIAKHFDLEEDGYDVVEEAIDTMTCVAWYINDMKRKHEHAVRLQEVQSLLINWKGPDLTTFGELVLEGTFRVHRVRNERTFFLFDRILLITKKRGDHYICKNDIPCSSMMLIESTRDSLCFTVAHYKHSKQQYNIQAKSGEEKRVWTHHIKRLILENHHAIIPQKAKEAILDMDSYYPSRYRYSPERLKKAWSCQATEDPPLNARQGRRQSEPFNGKNNTEKRLEGSHSSAVPGRTGRRKSEPTKQILKHLSSKVGLKHAGSDGALLEFGEPPQPPTRLPQQEKQQQQQQLTLPQESLEELAESDGSEKETGPEEEEEEEDKAEEDEEELEERLVGTEQVADFASALMNILHCWHCRANALLFSGGSMGKGHKAQEGPKQCQPPSSSEKNGIVEAAPPLRAKAQSVTELNKASEVSLCQDVPPTKSPSASETVGTLDPDQRGALAQFSDCLEPAENAEELKPLSSEEEEEDGNASQPQSILPFSVLDQASIIAERFASSFSRRSSLVLEEGKGYLTPKQASQAGSVLSLDGSEKSVCRNNGTTSSQLPEPPGEPSSVCSGAVSSARVETDHASCRRKESMLSQQDRLLLNKIKNYYDYAEHQDAGFSVRRRESLSYIPQGLVRNSVFRINSLPQPEPAQELLKRKRVGVAISSGDSRTAAWVLSNRPAVGSQAPFSEQGCSENCEAEFKPPAEMIKVWEEMERSSRELWTTRTCTKASKVNGQMTAGASLQKAEPRLKEGLRSQENGFDLHEPLLILEDEDLGAIAEESAVPSPESRSPVERASPARLPWKPVQELGNCEQDRYPPQLHPRLIQLAHLSEAELTEKMKNKVFQLARQYSLRIKRPAAHRRLAELEEDMKSSTLTGPQESDQKGKSKRKPALALFSYEQVVLQESGPMALLSASSQEKSPKRFSFSPSSSSPQLNSPTSTLSCSPLSPIVAEKFNWPDVQELRTKYSSQAGAETRRPPPVNKSRSAPEKMVDAARLLEEHRCSKKDVKTGEKSQRQETWSCRGGGGGGKTPWGSTPKDHACDSPKQFYVTAEATLEKNHQVIVIEKLPEAAGEHEETCVPIHSPPSREKISLKAVVEQCKSYQDSEEYCHAEESIQEPAFQKAPQQVQWEKTASLVKNMREKFQTLNASS